MSNHNQALLLLIVHLSSGIYIWEWITTVWFDWSIIVKSPNRSKILYLLLRYTTLVTTIIALVCFDRTVSMNCRVIFTVFQMTSGAVNAFATAVLAMRSIAIARNRAVTIFIISLLSGQWVLFAHGIFIKGDFVEGEGCVLTHISNVPLAVSALYGMTLDFVIFLIAVHNVRTGFLSWTQPGTLVRLFIKEGLAYFLSSFVANALAAIFLLINRDPSMAILANLPAAVTCAIASTRAVRGLHAHFLQTSQSLSPSDITHTPISFAPGPNRAALNEASIDNDLLHPAIQLRRLSTSARPNGHIAVELSPISDASSSSRTLRPDPSDSIGKNSQVTAEV